MNEEVIWLFYTYEYGGKISKMMVRNELMLEKFDDQTQPDDSQLQGSAKWLPLEH